MARLVHVMEWLATAGWVASLGLVVTRVMSPGDLWTGPAMALALAFAGTATISVMVLRSIPATFRAWERGVEHGRMLEREERTAAPGPRRLTPVR